MNGGALESADVNSVMHAAAVEASRFGHDNFRETFVSNERYKSHFAVAAEFSVDNMCGDVEMVARLLRVQAYAEIPTCEPLCLIANIDCHSVAIHFNVNTAAFPITVFGVEPEVCSASSGGAVAGTAQSAAFVQFSDMLSLVKYLRQLYSPAPRSTTVLNVRMPQQPAPGGVNIMKMHPDYQRDVVVMNQRYSAEFVVLRLLSDAPWGLFSPQGQVLSAFQDVDGTTSSRSATQACGEIADASPLTLEPETAASSTKPPRAPTSTCNIPASPTRVRRRSSCASFASNGSSASSADGDSPHGDIKSGVLQHQGKWITAKWRDRWFEIVDDVMYWFENEDSKVPRGSILLTDITSVEIGVRPHSFVMRLQDGDNHAVSATSNAERDGWISRLKEGINATKLNPAGSEVLYQFSKSLDSIADTASVHGDTASPHERTSPRDRLSMLSCGSGDADHTDLVLEESLDASSYAALREENQRLKKELRQLGAAGGSASWAASCGVCACHGTMHAENNAPGPRPKSGKSTTQPAQKRTRPLGKWRSEP